MKRFRLTLNKVRYDLSAYQCLMLSRKRLKLPDPLEWNDEQRIKSLVKQGLFRKRNGAFERTKLGSVVYNTIHDKVATEVTATPKE